MPTQKFMALLGVFLVLNAHFTDVWAEEGRISVPIKPLRLVSGVAETLDVRSLFQASDYHIHFGESDELQLAYQLKSKMLVIRPRADFAGFSLLPFQQGGREYVMPVFARKRQSHTFRIAFPEKSRDGGIHLMGNFNDWNRHKTPMSDFDGDGVYEVTLPFDPGRYLYQFVVDGREFPDPNNPDREDNGFGGYNSVFVLASGAETLFLRQGTVEFSSTPQRVSFILDSNYAGQPAFFALLNNTVLSDVTISGRQSGPNRTSWTFQVKLPRRAMQGKQVLRAVASIRGQTSNLQSLFLLDGVPAGGNKSGWDWHDGIIYSIIIDRFSDGNGQNNVPIQNDSLNARVNYMGGDLSGITRKLRQGYFDSLGINVLWLSPVNDNPNRAFREWPPPHRLFSGYHGYWPIHHQRIEEHFGDMAQLKELVATVHEHELKVLLDFTANHVHQEHPFFKAHPDWFGSYALPDGSKNIRRWDEFRLTTWFEPFLPSFDYVASEQALEVMTDNAVWWLQESGADGFRHDAVKHVPNRFWQTLTQKLHERIDGPRGAGSYQIGETFGSYDLVSSYVNPGQLDAQFNFNLYNTALSVFLRPQANFKILLQELKKTHEVYGTNHLMGNMMDSHDKVRYMAYADGDVVLNSSEAGEIGWSNPPTVDHASSYDKAKLYLAYLFTIPGVPVIYYGDEIGMTGAADPDNRRMMRFGSELSSRERMMFRDVRRIIDLRRRHSALRYGDFEPLHADQNIFAFARSDLRERVLVALNKSSAKQTVTLKVKSLSGTSTATDLMTGESFAFSGQHLPVSLDGFGWRVLKLHE